MTTTDYNQQAIDFLNITGTTFKATFLKNGKYFDDDKESRDIYEIELKRGSRVYKFNFGNSIAHSGKYKGHKNLCLNSLGKYFFSEDEYKKLQASKGGYFIKSNEIKLNPSFEAPTPYSVLACLTKYDPGTIEDFCSEYGYDTDSRKAEKTYKAVKDEYMNICALFNDAEIEHLQEIQ